MDVTIDQSNEIYEALAVCAAAVELNGPAYYMFCQEVAKTGKNIGDLTLIGSMWVQSLVTAPCASAWKPWRN